MVEAPAHRLPDSGQQLLRATYNSKQQAADRRADQHHRPPGIREPDNRINKFVNRTHMPLPLDDNRWNSLKTAYKMPATDVVEWLGTAYRDGMTDELLGDIINDVQHQGDTSEAMYPTAAHLLALAETCNNDLALPMIIQAGLICAAAQSPTAVPCPSDLEFELVGTKELGRKMALSQLACDHDFDNFKYLLAALAGFSNHGRFGRIIEGFDLYENQFHHALLDDPLEDEP